MKPRGALALVGLVMGATGGCASKGPSGGASDRIVIARSADPLSLDPARAGDIESLEIAEQVYGRLVRFSAGRLEPEPDLATSWSVSDDGTVWTFELRPDVRFHDGTPVDADAVVFSFERQILPEHPFHEADFAWTRAFHNIRRVRAVTPLRVQFDIDRPYAPFLANLAMGPSAIVSPAAVRKLGGRFARHPVGAGPYRFVEWIPGDRVTLERNPDYWDRGARTRYLVFVVMPESRQRLQALESGSADIIEQVAPDDLPLVRLHPDLRLVTAPAALVSYLAMNTQRRPLNDPRIRRAIATAIRRDALVKLIYQGVGIPAIGPLPPNVWGARSDVVTYGYDPARARKMLAEAGWSSEHAAPLKLYAPSAPSPYMPAPERVAAAIKTGLAEVGIRVEIVLNDPAEHQRALWAGEHDLALHGWFNDNGDPDNFLYTLLDSDNTTGSRPSNIAFYSNGWFHDVIGVAQRTTDRTERERLYSQAQAILATDVPWVPLAHSNVVFATRANIKGLVVQPSAMGLYRAVEAHAVSQTPDPPDEKPDDKPSHVSGEIKTLGPQMLHSSGDVRLSSMFRVSGLFERKRRSAPGTSSLSMAAPLRRRGLRRRVTVTLLVAALAPVIAVSAVALALIFSSVEQGIEFEAQRGLQVARGLFLQQVQGIASRAAGVSEDAALLRALAAKPGAVRQRLGELSYAQPTALLEVTDEAGHVVAWCAQGACNELLAGPGRGGMEPSERSPVVRRALDYERTVSIEGAGRDLVVRAGLPLVDPALRLLGTVVVTVPVDGTVVDRLRAALGAGREVIVYHGNQPTASTFMGATGARLVGPPLPATAAPAGLARGAAPVAALDIGGHPYSVAFGALQDVNGQVVGVLGIAVDREPLAAARRGANTTLALGVLAALLLAIGLAGLLARRMTKPLQTLHAGALSVARGDLDTRIVIETNDEIADVAEAFRVMTRSLKENQEGLAARVRELVTVHQVGRAVSSVVDLDEVMRSVVSEAVTVLGGKTAAIALAVDDRAKPFVVRAYAGDPIGDRLAGLAAAVAGLGRARRTPAVEADPQLLDAAKAAGLTGPVIATPLTLKDRMVGVIVVGRLGEAPFAEADLRLLVTFADQTATAIENARLYTEVRAFSEVLERRVRERTAQLERANSELERALRELGTAQGQLINAEKMANLGMLVAGIAHEVNSPAAAVQGLVDALQDTVKRLGHCASDLFVAGLPPASLRRYFEVVDGLLPEMTTAALSSTLEARQRQKRLKILLAGNPDADVAATMLAELGDLGERVAQELPAIGGGQSLAPLAGYLREIGFLARASGTIRTAIGSIRRIVGALKRYSRLDEAPLERVDLHAGIDDTLVILSHQLKYREIGINVKRTYGKLPPITAHVGELNQVWTNLIHNAAQAMGNSGELLIETKADVQGTEGFVEVAIEDNGPGIPADVVSRIFEPFFTTKPKGEGTGLGLSISARIIENHGGKIRVESAPGRTRFTVRLPVEGPAPVTSADAALASGPILQRASGPVTAPMMSPRNDDGSSS